MPFVTSMPNHGSKVLRPAQVVISQHFAMLRQHNGGMAARQDISPRALLAANIRKWMDQTPGMESPEKLAARCKWPPGHKKAGKKIAARSIRYLLDLRQDSPSPSIDQVFAIAAALNRQPWELLANDEQTRRYLVGVLLGSPPAKDDAVAKALGHAPKPHKATT